MVRMARLATRVWRTEPSSLRHPRLNRVFWALHRKAFGPNIATF